LLVEKRKVLENVIRIVCLSGGFDFDVFWRVGLGGLFGSIVKEIGKVVKANLLC
jgi:hypothetical protein